MSLNRTKGSRAAVLTIAAIMSAAIITACAVRGPGSTALASPGPSPSGSGTPVPGVHCGLACARLVLDSFGCAGGSGSDCGLGFRRDCACQLEIAEYRVIFRDAAGRPEVRTGRLVFAAGGTTATARFQASAPVTRADVELSIDGVVFMRQTVTATG